MEFTPASCEACHDEQNGIAARMLPERPGIYDVPRERRLDFRRRALVARRTDILVQMLDKMLMLLLN